MSATSTASVDVFGRAASYVAAKPIRPLVSLSTKHLEARGSLKNEEVLSRLANMTKVKNQVQNATDTLLSYMTELNVIKLSKEIDLARTTVSSNYQVANASGLDSGQIVPGVEEILEVEKGFQAALQLASRFMLNLTTFIASMDKQLEDEAASSSSPSANLSFSTRTPSGVYGSTSTSRYDEGPKA